jgi:hypothetical protein
VLRNATAGYGLRSTITETTQPRPIATQIKNTRDSVIAVKKTVEVITDRNSSLEERANAIGGLLKSKLPFGKKDNATWLQGYQKQKNKHDSVLEKVDGFEFRYEKVKRKDVEYIVFNIKSNYLIPTLRVDVEGNKELNPCTDKGYTVTGVRGDSSDVKYLLTGTTCEAQDPLSVAAVYTSADQCLFMIPLSELGSLSGRAQVNIILRSNQDKEPISWPLVSKDRIFEKYYDIKW